MEFAQFITFRPKPTWAGPSSPNIDQTIKHEQHSNRPHLLSSSSSSSQSKYQSSSTSCFESKQFLSQRVCIFDDGSESLMSIDSKGADEEVVDRRSLHFARRRGYEEEEGKDRRRKRNRHNQTSSSNHDASQITKSPFEIDLVMSLIWECLTWREQLTCRQVAKPWKAFYPMAPTRLLIMTTPSHHRIPKVLQPSTMDQNQQGVNLETFRRLSAICAADRDNNHSQGHYNSTRNTTITKYVSRLDLYIEAGGIDIEDSMEKIVSSLLQHVGGVRELRVFLHETPRNGASSLLCPPITTHTHGVTTWKTMTKLVIRHRQATRTYSRSTSSTVYLRFHAGFRNVAPNLREVDLDGTTICYNL